MAQFAIDLLYLEIILEIGTSWPPSITRWTTLDTLILGLSVPTKNTRTKKPFLLALYMKSILSSAESTVSKIKLVPSLIHFSLYSWEYLAAFKTESIEFQSPKNSFSILSGLI